MSDITMWFLSDAERLERFLATWDAFRRGGFKATQEAAADLAYMYGIEAPELGPGPASEGARALAMERFLAAWETYKRAGFKVTQEAVNELADAFGVKAPELEPPGDDGDPPPT